MCFIIDENIPKSIQVFLEGFGKCLRIFGGISDLEVLKKAEEMHCTLVTMDKDFGKLATLYEEPLEGVILIRSFDIEKVKEKLRTVLSKNTKRKFVVITDKKIRIRNIRPRTGYL